MAKKDLAPEGIEEVQATETVETIVETTTQGTAQEDASSEEAPIELEETIETVEVIPTEEIEVTDPEIIPIKEDVVDLQQIDFEEDVEFNVLAQGQDVEQSEGENLGGPVTEAKYCFSETALDEYLAKSKDEDKIIQISRGGNFVSNRTHEVYVPLSLFKK